MRRDFEGGIYWDEFAETCGDFRRQQDFKVRPDFKEIWCMLFFAKSVFRSLNGYIFTVVVLTTITDCVILHCMWPVISIGMVASMM